MIKSIIGTIILCLVSCSTHKKKESIEDWQDYHTVKKLMHEMDSLERVNEK